MKNRDSSLKNYSRIKIVTKKYCLDLLDKIKFELLKIPQTQAIPVEGLSIKLTYNKEQKTYFATAQDYPEIYTAANDIDSLLTSFHGVAQLYFGNTNVYNIKNNEPYFDISKETLKKLKVVGSVLLNKQKPRYATT